MEGYAFYQQSYFTSKKKNMQRLLYLSTNKRTIKNSTKAINIWELIKINRDLHGRYQQDFEISMQVLLVVNLIFTRVFLDNYLKYSSKN